MTKAAFMSVYGGLVPLGLYANSLQKLECLLPIPINLRLYIDFLLSYHKGACLSIRFLLKCQMGYAILVMPTGETGVNPVRDRRRKAQAVTVLIRMPQFEETPLAQAEKAGL